MTKESTNTDYHKAKLLIGEKTAERIKIEIANISTKLLTGKTVEELVEEIFKK